MQNIKNISHHILSKAWATLYRIDYDYQFKDGSYRRLKRECYNRGNGAAILLYNVERSTVILTKQFRMPIYENNIHQGMSIEVCAGAIDQSDSPLETVIRETLEEVGYQIKTAEQVLTAYMSPGALTEKMHLFIAPYTDAMKVSKGGGLASENEEIEILEIPFPKAIEMVKSEEIIDAKTIMLLQYALIHNILT